jgi:hypothetical protein
MPAERSSSTVDSCILKILFFFLFACTDYGRVLDTQKSRPMPNRNNATKASLLVLEPSGRPPLLRIRVLTDCTNRTGSAMITSERSAFPPSLAVTLLGSSRVLDYFRPAPCAFAIIHIGIERVRVGT